MRWLFWRGKDAAITRTGPARLRRRDKQSGCPTDDVEPASDLMGFARTYLATSNARVRQEGDDLLIAILPDGGAARYTTTPTRAEAGTDLLAPGSVELARMLDDVVGHARITSLRLARASDPVALARETLSPPAEGCGRCTGKEAAADGSGIALCATCPMRCGRIVLAGAGKPRAVTLTRAWEAHGVELTYRLSARDRGGRTMEWLRVAIDAASGRRLEPLSLERVERAQPAASDEDNADFSRLTLDQAGDSVRPALEAASCFIRQRSAEAYRARIADVMATHERLRREQPDQAPRIAAALERELSALAEVHAVEVRASLESICLIAAPMAEVLLRLPSGVELPLTVDVGRGAVASLTCGGCGAETRSASVCAHAQLLCPRCAPGCPAIHTQPSPPASPPGPSLAQSKPAAALGVQHLQTLPPALWRACVTWLLGCEGYAVTSQGGREDETDLWRGTSGGRPLVVQALRLPEGCVLGDVEVKRAAELRGGQTDVAVLLLSPAAANPEARRIAAELGISLWDREEVGARLAHLADQHLHGEARSHRAMAERATAAAKTRTALQAALQQAVAGLDNVATSDGARQGVVGHAALSAAVAELVAVQRSAEQAFIAWETLLHDWQAAFGERPSRMGALVMLLDGTQLRTLRGRATHLGKATQRVFERLARTSSDGEMGYGEWRVALIESYRARIAAYSAQIETIDPTAWEDAENARSAAAEAAADQASRAARSAAARAAKAHARLAQLIGQP